MVGCTGFLCDVRKVCWANAQAKRRKNDCSKCYRFVPHLHPERLSQPFSIRKPSRIGVCFMGDLYDPTATRQWQEMIYDVISKNPRHTFICLTKQPQNIPDRFLPENLWLGVTVNTSGNLWRLEKLLEKRTRIKIISCEPLYGDLGIVDLRGIGWIIIGAQTRPDKQPERSWVASLITQAHRLRIPVFLKDNLRDWPPLREYP